MERYRKNTQNRFKKNLFSNKKSWRRSWLLAGIWIAPLVYAFWAAFHPGAYAVRFDLLAPLTLENFQRALSQAPFSRYALNTFLLVTMILSAQLVLCTLAAYAFARFSFKGREIAFSLVLVQLMITPEILIVENYGTLARPTYLT